MSMSIVQSCNLLKSWYKQSNLANNAGLTIYQSTYIATFQITLSNPYSFIDKYIKE